MISNGWRTYSTLAAGLLLALSVPVGTVLLIGDDWTATHALSLVSGIWLVVWAQGIGDQLEEVW